MLEIVPDDCPTVLGSVGTIDPTPVLPVGHSRIKQVSRSESYNPSTISDIVTHFCSLNCSQHWTPHNPLRWQPLHDERGDFVVQPIDHLPLHPTIKRVEPDDYVSMLVAPTAKHISILVAVSHWAPTISNPAFLMGE
jgi:hypothetical protein